MPGARPERSSPRSWAGLLHTYRGPLVAGLALFAGTLAWAFSQWQDVFRAQRIDVVRHAAELARAVGVVVDRLDGVAPGDDARLRVTHS